VDTSIEVTLPRVPILPPEYWGKKREVRHLLGRGRDNAKLARSMQGAGIGYEVFGLSLAPARSSGFQVCPGATPGCSTGCLALHGRAEAFPEVFASRVAKTVAFFTHRKWFLKKLQEEISQKTARALGRGLTPCFRLNVYSDIAWECLIPGAFLDNPQAESWDYSKIVKRVVAQSEHGWPPNYRLTLSRSEKNERDCLRILDEGLGNVAVVFHTLKKTDALPPTWQGFPVIDGDKSDLRFLDPFPGYVVGLRAKGRARKDLSGFAVPLHAQTLALA
jgi:hypothetical protein